MQPAVVCQRHHYHHRYHHHHRQFQCQRTLTAAVHHASSARIATAASGDTPVATPPPLVSLMYRHGTQEWLHPLAVESATRPRVVVAVAVEPRAQEHAMAPARLESVTR